ncbi:AraC family transcriptional regulator [Vagococcus acidifermentans]|uniref:AraC family transcriptional regulator n=1 Tax=Vagococcus acidifermentans TaxID=564710 RepID=A0A430AT23_9ENTE|nr:AraC family transcriptional regulator [Vagococcus acidifermentans]RSU11219.1 AraC family transcriptional regulator [Vagococcus acidifermentans]
MSLFLEIPEWPLGIRFRTFNNSGEIVVPPHWHKEVEIIYVTKGSVNIGYNHKILQVHEGEIFVFESGVSHFFLASPESERLVYQFDEGLFREGLLGIAEPKQISTLFNEAENHSAQWPHQTTMTMRRHLETIYQEITAQPPGFQFAIIGALNDLVTLYFREIPKKQPSHISESFSEAARNAETLARLNQVFIFLEEHYHEGIQIKDVADHAGFSPYYFTRFFKKHTGSTFMQFLTEYRINQAKYILAHENLPMAEVAEKAGFNSVKTFHHVFKEKVGQSPLKYQKAIFGNN